jgi:hypothetical protein
MRHFHRRVKGFDLAAQIYRAVGDRPFTHAELAAAGTNIPAGSLVDLKHRGALAHLPDTTGPISSGIVKHQRVPGDKNGAKYWILTQDAVEVIQKELAVGHKEEGAQDDRDL